MGVGITPRERFAVSPAVGYRSDCNARVVKCHAQRVRRTQPFARSDRSNASTCSTGRATSAAASRADNCSVVPPPLWKISSKTGDSSGATSCSSS